MKKKYAFIFLFFILCVFSYDINVKAIDDTTCTYVNGNKTLTINITTTSDGAMIKSGSIVASNHSSITVLNTGGKYVCPNYVLYKVKSNLFANDKIYVSNSKTYLETLNSEDAINGTIYERSAGASESSHKLATCNYDTVTFKSQNGKTTEIFTTPMTLN